MGSTNSLRLGGTAQLTPLTYRYHQAARPYGLTAGRMELLVAVNSERSLRYPLGSGPVQQSCARDSKLACVQSGQHMHGLAFQVLNLQQRAMRTFGAGQPLLVWSKHLNHSASAISMTRICSVTFGFLQRFD